MQGLANSGVSTALPDLVLLYDTSTADISATFVAGSLGKLSAAALCASTRCMNIFGNQNSLENYSPLPSQGGRLTRTFSPFLVLSGFLCLLGLVLGLYPFLPTWGFLMPLAYLLKLSTGAIFISETESCPLNLTQQKHSTTSCSHTHLIIAVSTTLCLEIWRDSDASSYLHSVQFCLSLGSVIAPAMGSRILSTGDDDPTMWGVQAFFLIQVSNFA